MKNEKLKSTLAGASVFVVGFVAVPLVVVGFRKGIGLLEKWRENIERVHALKRAKEQGASV